ncbi:acid phosphatase, class B [Legionella beliardensis]|uniref:Acid phosphatase, class B n=1 Tax=Legionella beliardensis TaxID=91822 RepID=A0A378I419_9GAMM|nr:HAD family acid phosphatase [Legionella beliardensis]STX29441.1 acid phosphatase, class B [Legionella beliardensis]
MKYIRIFFVISCVLSFNAVAEPPNLSLIKKEIETYHDSGAYEQELTNAIMQAHQYITNQVATNNHRQAKKQLAVVLDIDETSLSNYDKLARRNFMGTQAEIHQEILAANSLPIKPMLSLYNDALKQGVKVFFVTGRQQSECEVTAKNLLNAGYKNWAGLYCKPDNYSLPSIINFKAKTRALITKQGYTIVATIGDQYSDLLGGFAQKEFKLPNPFYYLP